LLSKSESSRNEIFSFKEMREDLAVLERVDDRGISRPPP